MLALAAGVSNESYAHYLLPGSDKDLSWGPTLFRVLLAFHGLLLAVLGSRFEPPAEHVAARSAVHDAHGQRVAWPIVGVLVALSVVAGALRLWNLNSDLWIDEVLTLLDFARKPFGEILTSFPNQNQHMLFSILARAAMNVFGDSAWALRLPSVLFGVACIWAFFFLCRRFLHTREALLACVLMTVSYHHIWFSQNARGYMGLLLFTLLATWFWLEALGSNRWRWWIGYTAAVVLGMWVHPTMAFVVAAHGLVYLVLLLWPGIGGVAQTGLSFERRAGLRPFVAWVLSVTVTLQLYALALPEFLAIGLHEESHGSEWTNPLWVVTETLKGLSIGFAGIAVVVCAGAFVAFGWASLFRSDRRAAVLMVLPAILAGFTMLLLGHNLWPRFFFFSMGFGLLIVIHGAVRLPQVVLHFLRPQSEGSQLPSYAGIAFVFVMILASLFTLPKNYAQPKQNYSGAKSFVESRMAPGDSAVAVSLAGIVYGGYLTPFWPIAKTSEDLARLQSRSGRTWLVYTLPIEMKAAKPDLWREIQNDYEIVQVFPGTLNGGEVFVCQKRMN